MLLKNSSEIQIVNNKHLSPIGLALSKGNYLLAAKIMFDTEIDLSREYVTTYTSKRVLTTTGVEINEIEK